MRSEPWYKNGSRSYADDEYDIYLCDAKERVCLIHGYTDPLEFPDFRTMGDIIATGRVVLEKCSNGAYILIGEREMHTTMDIK